MTPLLAMMIDSWPRLIPWYRCFTGRLDEITAEPLAGAKVNHWSPTSLGVSLYQCGSSPGNKSEAVQLQRGRRCDRDPCGERLYRFIVCRRQRRRGGEPQVGFCWCLCSAAVRVTAVICNKTVYKVTFGRLKRSVQHLQDSVRIMSPFHQLPVSLFVFKLSNY